MIRLAALGMAPWLLWGQAARAHPRIIVLVIDGLRPDMITAQIMPNLFRLKQEGAWCENAHSVFPTVTRVNSTSMSTGALPAAHGIVSNTMYVEGVAQGTFDTNNYRNLIKLADLSGGRAVAVTTMAEALQAAGISFASISSGSTGASFLMNPMAQSGRTGALINGGLEDGRRVAFPDAVDREVRRRFGGVKSDEGLPSLLWTERVHREYVVSDLRPQVTVDWLTEPDTTQHRTGVGSPESLAVLKTVDEQIGLLLARLRELGAGNTTDIIVTADHGFAAEPDPVDLEGAIKATGDSGRVITASNGASVLLYVKDHDAQAIERLVSRLQQTDGVDLIFSSSERPQNGAVQCRAGRELGWVPGTFSLELIGQCRPARAADLIVTFQWNSDKNAFGFPGTQRIATTDSRRNVPGRSGHGGLSAWMVHTPLLLWGPDFRKQAVLHAPVANFDIAPTILALEGVKAPDSMSGRAIAEGFANAPGREPQARTRTVEVRRGAYCAAIELSEVEHRTYIDRGERCGRN